MVKTLFNIILISCTKMLELCVGVKSFFFSLFRIHCWVEQFFEVATHKSYLLYIYIIIILIYIYYIVAYMIICNMHIYIYNKLSNYSTEKICIIIFKFSHFSISFTIRGNFLFSTVLLYVIKNSYVMQIGVEPCYYCARTF